jgi:hypothetical protein
MLVRNSECYPDKLKENEIHEFFDDMDYKYKILYDKYYK